MPIAPRLTRLPLAPPLPPPADGGGVRVAATPPARLRGLAHLDRAALAPGDGLLLPRTRSIHTFGMRFALDLMWLDGDGRIVRIDRAVPPRRLRACRRARAVVELPAAGPAHDGAGTAWARGGGLRD